MTVEKDSAAGGTQVPGWRRYVPACIVLAAVVILATFVFFPAETSADTIRVHKIAEYAHDPRAFTQGLAFHDSKLFEGTGRYQESTLREIDLQTGDTVHRIPLRKDIFGEGITVFDGRIYQLTWQNGFLISWDLETLKQQKPVSYRRIDRSLQEGWGITHDGRHLIISDGTSLLRFVDPKTWRTVRRVRVRSAGRTVTHLNELEFVNGEILANVWYQTRIARINPENGQVNGWLELQHLVPPIVRHNREAVLNGIAWDAKSRRLFVTGKLWPALLEVTFEGLPPRR